MALDGGLIVLFSQPRNLRVCGSEETPSSSVYISGHEVKIWDLRFGAAVTRKPTSSPTAGWKWEKWLPLDCAATFVGEYM